MATTTTTYTSQQSAIMASMVSYLQNAGNWPNGIPLLTDFTPGSVVYTLLASVSVAVDALGLSIYMTRLAAYISTATGADLDAKVGDFGLTRNVAVAASGTFTFTKNTPAVVNTVVPSGSLISTIATASESAVVFVTDDDMTLLIGNTSVDVPATAQVTGSGSNIAAGGQLLIASMVPGVDGVTLALAIENGADEETDDALRARGLAAFVALAHGTVESYRQIVLAVAGIGSAIVVPQDRGPGTVDIFVMGPENSVPSPTVLAEAQAAIDAQKVATDDVRVLLPTTVVISATINVHLAGGYDPTVVALTVRNAITAYIEGLGVSGGAPGHVYSSQLVATALSVAGVLNATTTFVDTLILSQQLPVAGVVTVDII